MTDQRLDHLLAKLFPELTRSKLQSLIERKKIEYQNPNGEWKPFEKPGIKWKGESLSSENTRILPDDETFYVSRGALKIKKAVETYKIPITDCLILDMGVSTGGFSDYFLHQGARKILGLDVGTDQLHPSLKSEKRLVTYDKINGKMPLPQPIMDEFFKSEPQNQFDLIAIDVSFISLEKVLPNLFEWVASQGFIIPLVKPQFELAKKDLNKKGVVKDSSLQQQALEKIIKVFNRNQFGILGHCLSPIEGENGNKEFLLVAHRN